MNNLQRIERFCGAQWSTASEMRNPLNTINIICAQKDTEAFDALLQQCTHNRQLADFVLDSNTVILLLDNQWDAMWMKFIGLTLEGVPEKIDKIMRWARANPTMYYSAQDLVWQKIGVYEQNISKNDQQNLKNNKHYCRVWRWWHLKSTTNNCTTDVLNGGMHLIECMFHYKTHWRSRSRTPEKPYKFGCPKR